jgi:OOP family OmpA-OmpF porin
MKKIALLSLLIVVSSFTLAKNKNAGFYAGANIGIVSSETYLLEDGSFGAKTNTGGMMSLGYQFNKYFATELSYLYIGNSSAYGIDQNQSFLTANVKGIMPLNKKFNVFAKAGLGYNFASINGSPKILLPNLNVPVNSNNLTSVLGIGLGYNITKCIQLTVSDDYYVVPVPKFNDSNASSTNFGFGNTNFFSLGINYKF